MTDPTIELKGWATASGPAEVAVRDLLALWGAKRRSFQAVDQINRDLRRHGLRAEPPIIDVPIDDRVSLIRLDGAAEAPAETNGNSSDLIPPPPTPPVKLAPVVGVDAEVRMKVSWIPSANFPVEKISPSADLTLAQSKMLRHDYSQLAVQSGERDEPRAVSWESIAKARIKNRDATMRDAIEPVMCVYLSDALLPLISTIIEKGYVFVRGHDRTLKGIVTTADLSKQFEEFAKPFLMLGEIERGLRVVLDSTFRPVELASVRDPRDSDRQVENAGDLTIGEMLRLLQSPSNFDELGWVMDRKEFIAAMQDVADLRNEVMHFSPDAIGSDELRVLRNFQQMLQKLAPQL